MIALSLLFSRCGTQQEPPALAISPSADFDQLHEDPGPAPQRCGGVSGFGCGSVSAVGSLVKGSFVFKELFVTCGQSAQGLFLTLSNSITAQPTFSLSLGMWSQATPPKIKVCKGLSTANGSNGGIEVQAGSCDVIVKVHQETLHSTANRPCMIQSRKTDPWEGTIQCPFLEEGRRYIIIEGSSTFQCPST